MTSGANPKSQVLEQVDDEWRRLVQTAQTFSEAEQLIPGAVGHWSVKDVLGHVATWDGELVKVVERFRRSGEETDYGDGAAVDHFNQAEVEKQRELSPGQVWDLLHQSHQRLLDFLRGLPEEAFAPNTYTGDWIATDSGGHYREHREDLERWKASRA